MFLSPLQGLTVITQAFGLRPEVYKQFGLKGHSGLDLRAPTGTQLFAPIDGIVSVGDQGKSGYGKYIRIRNHFYEVVLAHLSKFEVDQGQEVKMGDLVALSGNTGFSTAAHVHFGVRKLGDTGNILNAQNGYLGYVDQSKYTLIWSRALK